MCQYTTKQTEPGTLWCVSVLETVRQKKCTLSSFCFCTYFYNFLLLSFKKKCWPGWLHPDASLGRAGSPQCMLWLHYQMFNVDLNLNKTKQKRSFPNCTFSVVPPQKNLIAKTCEWGKNMRMIAKKCEFAYYWGKYCFLSGGIFPSTVNQFLLYHQSNFK